MTRPLVCLVMALTGCVAQDELVEFGTTTQQVAGCPKWVCGSNDPVVSSPFGPPVNFHELSENPAVANAEGISLLGLSAGGLMYKVDVAGGRLYGRRRGKPTLSGAILVGATLVIQATTVKYNLKIVAVGKTDFYPLNGEQAETYQIEQWAVGETNDKHRNLCSQAEILQDDSTSQSNELLGMSHWTLLLYENSRVDANTKVITEGDPTWFNVACAGHVLAKTYLVRHTIGSQSAGFFTTPSERQAMLRMYLADYCGDGTPFTQSGEPLVWMDDAKWFGYWSPPTTLEARWGPNGVTCLNEPRMFDTDPAGQALFPNIEAAISAQCTRPPQCVDLDPYCFFDPSSTLFSHIVSSNPW